MHYEANVSTYQRVKPRKNKELNISLKVLNIMVVVLMGFMLSRISIKLVDGLILAPFGVSYLIAVINDGKRNKIMLTTISVLLGYLTMYSIENKSVIYLGVVTIISLYSLISKKFKKSINRKIIIALVLTIYTSIGVLIGQQGVLVDFIFSLISAIAVIPVALIIEQGMNCFGEVKADYLFSTEELISMALLICLTVAGVGNLAIFNIDIRNIIALAIVIIIAYAGGSGIGAILGIIMGIIIGVTSNNIVMAVALYSICGLVVGVFSITNKIISLIAYFITCFIVMNYSGGVIGFNFIDVIISGIFLLLVPVEISRAIFKEINNEEKQRKISNNQLEGIKSEFVDRINNLKGILLTVSSALDSLSGNDNLLVKNKSVAMVENLADRVCYNCEMNEKCWNKELHNTFNAFGDLIGAYQNKKVEIPKDLIGKCVKINTLIKNTQDIISVHSVNETVRKRLIEGRKLISSQVNNISEAIDCIINDFDGTVDDCYEVDNSLKKILNKKNIDFNEVYSYRDEMGKLKIKIKLNNNNSENYYIKTILPIISNLINVPVSIAEEGFKINPMTNECSIIIEETPKYHIESYAAFKAKDGEEYSGDSFSFGKNKKGLYVTAISDGMGSGPEANAESEATIRIIEKFMEFGFDENTAVNSINSIMGMKFNENEKFTTLDMNTIDLYTGDISFIKVGGVASFIKRDKKIEVIESSGLPFGILDSMELDLKKNKIESGDIIVTVSDGILDMDKGNAGDFRWVEEYLESSTINPEKLSRELLEEAKKRSLNKLSDDMTVVVSKVYSV